MMSARSMLLGALALLLATTAVGAAAQPAIAGPVTAEDEPPRVLARSWVVADATTGEILAAKRPHERRRPASTLKILTAITLLPRLDLADRYRVQWEDANVTGSAVGIVPGSRYTIDELFYGLMLPSGNDAARALASANGGSRQTVRQMNRVAESLGALDTTAANPTGLDAPEQLSSAFDLALLAREGLTDADFRRYVSTVSIPFPAQEPKRDKPRDSFMIYNQNPLLLDGYRGAIGVKTGYTTEAGRTFVAAAQRGGRTLLVALMGVVEPSESAAGKLLTWGFTHPEAVATGSLDAERPAPAEPSASAPVETQVAAVLPAPTGGFSWPLALGVTLACAIGLLLVSSGWWYLRRRP